MAIIMAIRAMQYLWRTDYHGTTLIVPSVCPLINCVIKANEGRMGGREGAWKVRLVGKVHRDSRGPRQPTRRDAMRARCVAARLIDDSGRNAKSATWRPQIDVRCPIHCSDGTIEREHCRTAFLCARVCSFAASMDVAVVQACVIHMSASPV